MALDCAVHELIFVVVTVPPRSQTKIALIVTDVFGDILGHARVDLDGVVPFLQPWLSRPCTHVRFMCTLLSGTNVCALSRHLHNMGYYDVGFNAIAYTCLTPEMVYRSAKQDEFYVARVFGDHLVEDTRGWSIRPNRTRVFVAATHVDGCGVSVAAGTIEHGVLVAHAAHYVSDICEAFLPWFTKQALYEIVFVSNYATEYSWTKVNQALARHGYSLSVLDSEKMKDPKKRLGRFFMKDVNEPGFVFARCMLETFIIKKRMT